MISGVTGANEGVGLTGSFKSSGGASVVVIVESEECAFGVKDASVYEVGLGLSVTRHYQNYLH